ncbi:hypothetical protein ABFA07_016615 [Porites harrisoni]
MMTEMDIKKILVETFPFLKCQSNRLYCAGAKDNRTRLNFYGERRIWNGRFIKQKIKGNSALYIYAEEDSTVVRQIEASGIDNQSLSASSESNKSIKQPAACPNTGAHLGSVRTVAETATVTPLVRLISSPSLAIVSQRIQNAIPMSSVCATQIPTHSGEQSSLRCSDEGYEHPSKKRKTAQNVSKHSETNPGNRFGRKRSYSMTSSNSVPMSVSCPVASDQQSLEQPISPNTGAITDTSKLAAQMENLRFGEKAGSSGKRVDNGADSSHDSQSKPLPTEEITELGGQPHKGWSLGGGSSSLTGEQPYFIGQQTLDDIYHERVGVSMEELDTNPRMEINRQQEAAVIADPGAQGLTEGSDQYFTSSDINATSSGIYSDDDSLDSSDQNNLENLSQDQVIRTEARQDFEPKIDPDEVPFYKGADIFHIIFEHPPPCEVQSLRAIFESLGVVPLIRLNDKTFSGRKMPAAPGPCSVKVSVESEDGRRFGETKVEYVDDPDIYPILFRHLASKYDGSDGHAHGNTSNSANGESSNGNTQGDTGSSGNGGFTQQLQSLQHLVNAMVASGAQWLIEPIFKSTAGRMLLHSYKETSQLPEVIARKNGHEETVKFLADITKRLSEETEFFPDDVQKIDWSELVFLVERATEQKIGGIAVDQENYQAENDLTIDTGYFGDVETSSGNLSLQSKSDSDDNSSEISFEDSFEEVETQPKTDAFKKYSDGKPDLPSPDLSDVNFPKEGKTQDTLFWVNKCVDAMENLSKDKSLQLKLHSPATACSGCLMSLNDVNSKGRRYKNTGICKENFFLQMLPDLQNGKSDYRYGVSVLLKLASEDIPRHLTTMHERWITRIQLNKNITEETTQLLSVVMRKIQFNPAEGGSTSVTQPAITMKSNFVQASKIWIPNCLYRPTRKTFFVYVGDSLDFFPLQWFEDEDCELSTNCWKWCEYRDRLGERVIEVQEQSEFKESQQEPSPSNPPVTYMLPQINDKGIQYQGRKCPAWIQAILYHYGLDDDVERTTPYAVRSVLSLQPKSTPALVLEGDLFEALPQAEQPKEENRIALAGVERKDLSLQCEDKEVKKLTVTEAESVLALSSAVQSIDPAMSGEAPEHNPERLTSAPPQQLTGSAPVRRYVPITLTVDLVLEHIEIIRQKYKRHEGWLAPFPCCDYFQLKLSDIYRRLRVVSREKKARATAEQRVVQTTEIFNPDEECKQPRKVLVVGKPGMGRTTYCYKVAYDWARNIKSEGDCFLAFEMVFLQKCRDVEIESDLWEAIDDQLLPGEIHRTEREKFFDFIRQNQSKVLLTLDGLDVLPSSKLPEFTDIIQGKILPLCHLVVTARHETELPVRKVCDTLLEIEEFTYKYIVRKEDLAEKLLDKVQNEERLREMAKNPLNFVVLCLLCEDFQGILPESRTQLYSEIIQCALIRCRKKKGLPVENEDLTEIYKDQLKLLGSIALNGLYEYNTYFGDKKLSSENADLPEFGFLSVQPGSSKRRPCLWYSFTHNSFQEFFAGYYLCCQLVSKETSPEILVTDTRYFRDLSEVLKFTCGLLAVRSEESAVALINCVANEVNKADVEEECFAVALECIKECKIENSYFHIDLARTFGACLEVQQAQVRDPGVIDVAAAAVLAAVLEANTTLTTLDLHGNNIGPAGAESLATALEANTTLTNLNLFGNNIGPAGAESLATALKTNTTLTNLYLSVNDIGPAGAESLATALKTNTTLKTLYLHGSNIGPAGAESLATALKTNTTLTNLDLHGNNIGPAGAESLATALKTNTTLTNLDLHGNNIGPAGAESLATALKTNTTLTNLDLPVNNVGPAGAESLATALKKKHNSDKFVPVCQ